jgi:hypothetical protein
MGGRGATIVRTVMQRCVRSRWMCRALVLAIVATLPLALTGCVGNDSAAAQPPSMTSFMETHKDSMKEFLKNKPHKPQKGARR